MMMRPRLNDAEIQQAVLKELEWDGRVSATEVGVEVANGVVTLSGTVSSWAKRNAAEQAAHAVRGVLDVANELRVHVPGSNARTDAEIAAAVRHTLQWNEFIPHEAITTTVTNGWVTLEGTLDSYVQREEAEAAVRNLASLTGVTNNIVVVTPKRVVRQAIEEALERRARREASRVQLEVRDGHIIVRGQVQSWPEKQAVLGAVKGTAGVQSVEDMLIISPFNFEYTT